MENSDNETRHNTNAVVSEQDLADTYFPAFVSCANRGKASGVMCSYNAVNGSSALSLCMSPHFSVPRLSRAGSQACRRARPRSC